MKFNAIVEFLKEVFHKQDCKDCCCCIYEKKCDIKNSKKCGISKEDLLK